MPQDATFMEAKEVYAKESTNMSSTLAHIT